MNKKGGLPVTSILGQHISLIRPGRIQIPIIYKSEHIKALYNEKPKTIHAGRVVAVLVWTIQNDIVEFPPSSFNDDFVVGWKLSDKTTVWK